MEIAKAPTANQEEAITLQNFFLFVVIRLWFLSLDSHFRGFNVVHVDYRIDRPQRVKFHR